MKKNQEKIDVENLESLNVGLVGHYWRISLVTKYIDHGKTTLVYNLTGKWTDTHSEELRRGITIKLGYADMIIKNKQGKVIRYVSFVDAPGHEMLMATMLSGAAMIDAAILVIAANEGIKPQTREHLMALQAKNVKNVIIVQNKIDLVSKEQAVKNYKEIKDFVKGTIAENSFIIPISAQQGVNVEKVSEALAEIKIPTRDIKSEPVFVVARSFDINRPGASIQELKGGVLGGALLRGNLKEGEEIEIKPGITIKKENQIIYETIRTEILGIFKGRYKVEKATPGGSLAIETSLDPLITKSDSLSGCVFGLSGKLPEISDRVKIKFNLFKEVYGLGGHEKVENIKTQELLLLSANTSITIGTVIKLTGQEAELNLRIPIVPFKGNNVGIARNIEGHWRLIGWGEIIGEWLICYVVWANDWVEII